MPCDIRIINFNSKSTQIANSIWDLIFVYYGVFNNGVPLLEFNQKKDKKERQMAEGWRWNQKEGVVK